MSKTSATPNKQTSTKVINLPEKRLSAKQSKHLAQEDDNAVMSDSTPQIGESNIAATTTPLVSETTVIIAQANTVAPTQNASTNSNVLDTTTSTSGALNSTWVIGLAAVGSAALVAHDYNKSNSTAGTVEGIAIDGYLQNANVYTVNGTTKTKVGTTDSNGKFSIKNPNGDLIQIEGGTNKDTGLANTVVLKAPGTATGNIVVTPLTTTIAAMMTNDSHLTASQAAEKLKTSLGITGDVNLLTLDSIASNNTTVQKANVQIATALSLVTQAGEADAVLNDLASTVNHASIALNLNTTLTNSLTSQTTLDTTTLSAISEKLTTLAAASNIASLGDVQKAAMANDAPTLIDIPASAQTVTVGQATVLTDFKVADKNGDTLTVTLTASHGTVNGLTDADANTAGIQLTGTASAINTQLAAATFTADTAGDASIGISVTDGKATAVTGSYAITAAAAAVDTPDPVPTTPVVTNDAPTLTGLPSQAETVTVGQAAALADFTVADANNDTLTVTLTSSHGTVNGLTDADANTAGIQLTGTASAINTQLAAATFTADTAGDASIGISVTDGKATAITGSYAISASSIVSGSIVAGPVLSINDLVVNLYAADGTTQIGTANVDANGQYSAQIGSYTGVVIAKVSSAGTGIADYLDEATGQQLDLTTVLTAVGVASNTGLNLNVNPLTTIAAQLAGLDTDGSGVIDSEAAVDSANATVATAFGIQDSLIAPSTLEAIVDVNGGTNAEANDYGKVLAVLSSLDQINHGDLQTAISGFATELFNTGHLSSVSKFKLVVAAQDADLMQASSELASTMGLLVQIDAHDVQEAISSGRGNFSNEELASALSIALNTTESVRVDDIDAVIASITSSNSNDLTSLSRAADQYVVISSGSVLNLQEAQDGVTLYLHGLGLAAGDRISVSIQDPNAIFDNGVVELADLEVRNDGHTVMLPDLSRYLWTSDTATETDSGAPLSFNITHNGISLTGSFGVDMYVPGQMTTSSLTAQTTGPWSGYTNGSNSSITVWEPQNNWNQGDHWQYKVGNDGQWLNGSDFLNGKATISLQNEGAYGTNSDNKIHLRSYDDAGNVSTEVISRAQFTYDATTPELNISPDGVSINESGYVALLNDAVVQNLSAADLKQAIVDASNNSQDSVPGFNTSNPSGSTQPLDTSVADYGTHHYYAVDYAGNVTRDTSEVIIDSKDPVLNGDFLPADQTVYRGDALDVWIDASTVITDPDGHPLTYTATLLDANGTAVSTPSWLTLTIDHTVLTLTATADDVASHMTAPLTIQLTATNSAGVTEKSLSDDFTLNYIPNRAPVLDWPIDSWNVNVGVDTNDWGNIQTHALDIFSDSDNDPLTYAITNADGSPAPAWLSIHTDSNGNPFLQAIPLAGDVSDIPYQFTVTATDGHSDPVSDTFDLVVGDNGFVFYPGEALSSFNLTLAANSVTGQAITTSHPDSVLDLGVNNTYFFGGPAMGDTANLHLDNATGGTLFDETAPSLTVENFSTVNLLVDSHTELQSLSMWKLYSADELLSQNVTIQTGAGAALVVDWMDTADFANTTMSISGSDDVTINMLDGNWGSYTDTSGIVQSPEMFLSANQLTGKLKVTYQGLAATLFGGQNDDTITGGDGDDTISGYLGSDTLAGGDGADVFYYASSLDANDSLQDVITDFTTGVDKIRVNLSNNASDASNLNLTFSVVADYNTGVNDALTGNGKMGESFYSTLDGSLYIDADGNGSVTDSTDFVIRSTNAINAGDLEFMIAGTSHIV